MAADRIITMVVGQDTPEHLRHHAGRVIPIRDDVPLVVAGPGMLMGVPGHLDGWTWVIHEVDMRSDETRMLDEARDLLSSRPQTGDRLDELAGRLAKAQWLILKVQERAVRRMWNGGA